MSASQSPLAVLHAGHSLHLASALQDIPEVKNLRTRGNLIARAQLPG